MAKPISDADLLNKCLDEYDNLRAENERLRAALLKIEEILTRPDMASDHTFVVTAVYNLAREALAVPGGE